jgi:3-methyl-2-oxobutanoate hydroxymethyltransferase
MAALPPRVTVPLFRARKGREPLVVVTAYDAPQGRLADAAGVDAILVGDSLGMTTLGYDSTLPVTIDDVILHARAVRRGQEVRPAEKNSPEDAARGARHALLIADMPFGSYGISVEEGVRAGVRVIQEGGAQAVKVEGAGPVILETIRRLVDIGAPVMAHLGMTPQSVNRFGGFKVQGRTEESAEALLTDARAVVDAGAFGMVLEVIPAALAARITESVPAPTIGIGAGAGCDGQVQVLHDLVGLTDGPTFRHAKRYVEAGAFIQRAVAEFAADVRTRRFPTDENAF